MRLAIAKEKRIAKGGSMSTPRLTQATLGLSKSRQARDPPSNTTRHT